MESLKSFELLNPFNDFKLIILLAWPYSNDNEDENSEEDANFINYFLDNINYKIFKCYKLLIIFNNLKNNYESYAILSILFIILIITLIF